MRFWTSDNAYEVRFADVTDQRAASGKRSFKIDVLWKDCTYNYWQSAPLMIPYYGSPRITGKLYVERGSASLGYANAYPEAETSGNVSRGEQTQKLPNGWTQWLATASGPPGGTQHVQSVALYLKPDSEGRTVVYVDDLQVEASLPDDYQAQLQQRIAEATAALKASLQKQTSELRQQFDRLAAESDRLSHALPADASPALAECWRRGQEYCRNTRSELAAQLARLQAAPTSVRVREARAMLTALQRAESFPRSLAERARDQRNLPYLVWIVDPVSDSKILPDQFPVSGVLGTDLAISACAGEYEPASFAVFSPLPVRRLAVQAGPMKCGDREIPASAVDVRIVKCWWQAGVGISDLNHPTLTPELLLNDPDFVRVDNAAQRNTLKSPDAPRDAPQLQPISIPAGSAQQFWVTVHVPDGTAPGVYRGPIHLTAADSPPVDLTLSVDVLPFNLEQPILEYSIYYRGKLQPGGKGSISSEAKSDAQYLAEMVDLKAHGVTHPTTYQSSGPALEQAIALRKQAGIALEPFYSLGIETGAPKSPQAIDTLRQRVENELAWLTKFGIRTLYVYGIDEASGEALKAERQAFQAVHQAGAKVFVACYTGSFDLVGDLLDLAVHSGALMPLEAIRWHGAGHRIFSYGNPQVGVEKPETYRRNYGLALWKAGFDGACDYAYQHAFGQIWDDFDHHHYRDHVFAYPTVDGVVDTIQWEGFREGVDDIRYLSTLLHAIDQAKADPARRPLAADAEAWIKTIDPNADLNAVRKQIIHWILRLRPKAQS